MAEEANESGRGSSWSVWLAVLLVAPVLYVLSIGPARVAYAPVFWLHQHTPLQKPLDDYLDFWEQVVGGMP